MQGQARHVNKSTKVNQVTSDGGNGLGRISLKNQNMNGQVFQ